MYKQTFKNYLVFEFNKNFSTKLKGKILRLLTRSPRKLIFVQLACVKHTTSVHPEPGSNSYYNNYIHLYVNYIINLN